MLLSACAGALAAECPSGPKVLEWEPLPSLPDSRGLAGAFVGVSGDALIVAGGVRSPDEYAARGRRKVWQDNIHVLAKPDREWRTGYKLPRALACGVSLTTAEGVVLLGGGDAEEHYAEVWLLRWADGEIEIIELPSLPSPAAFFCGAMIDNTIYVAGGREQPDSPTTLRPFWALDLFEPNDELHWEVLPPWPGKSRMLAVAAVQDGLFFLISGVTLDPSRPGDDKRVFLTDGYVYRPKTKQWKPIAGVPRCVAAAPTPAVALGDSHFAVVGGVHGASSFPLGELQEDAPGFPADILTYHTITDTWTLNGQFPKNCTF